MGALVTHVGSGYEPEIESAFLVLASLVDLYSSKMAPFNVFLKVIWQKKLIDLLGIICSLTFAIFQ